MVDPSFRQVDCFHPEHRIRRRNVQFVEFQDELTHLRLGFLQPISKLLEVVGLGRTKVSVLDCYMMNTVALSDYCGKIQDVESTTRIVRMRAPLE